MATAFTDYKVKDMSLAEWGRKEIDIAETEMPGLMALRDEFGKAQAAEGRPHRRLPAHDHPDRGADRDADGARRRRALVVLQHLLDPGPGGRSDRRRRHPGVRLEGRERGRVLVVHRADRQRPERLAPQHDPGRRRRPHRPDARQVSAADGEGARHQRGDHHRRAPPVRDGARTASSRCRRSTSTTRSPSRSSTTSTAAARAWSTASSAPPT